MNSNYKYYYFEDPYASLIIAKDADDAVLKYQDEIADIRDGVTFEEVSKQEFVEDKGDVLAIKKEIIDLYEEMEHELYCICNEINDDRLEHFKWRYFTK